MSWPTGFVLLSWTPLKYDVAPEHVPVVGHEAYPVENRLIKITELGAFPEQLCEYFILSSSLYIYGRANQ